MGNHLHIHDMNIETKLPRRKKERREWGKIWDGMEENIEGCSIHNIKFYDNFLK